MNIIYKTSLLTALIGSLVACTADHDQTITHTTEKELTQKTIVGKPSAPISMSYKMLNSTAQPNEEINIEVSFQSQFDSPISIQMNSAEKLTWLNNSKNWQREMNKSGVRETLPPLKVIAPENGLYYIRLMASVVIDGKTLSKPFTIPVKVGDGSVVLEPVGEVVVDEKGQRVIIQKSESNK